MTLCLQYSLFTYNTTILLGDFFIDDLHNRTCTSIRSTYTHTRANRRSYFTSVEVRRLVNQQTIERKIRPDLPRSGRSGRKGMAKRRQKRSVNNKEERNDPLFFRTSIHFLPIPFLPSSPSLSLSPSTATSATRCKLRFRDLLVFSPRMEAPTKGFQT